MGHDHDCHHEHAAEPLHDHESSSSHGIASGKMGLAVGLTLSFVLGETIAGYFSHSLALLSDAGHNFADAAALGFSWYALWIAKRPSHPGMTFGYHRVGILAALVNAVSLVVIALFIIWEAIGRLHHPATVNSWLMIGVASVAVVMNLVIGLWLHAGAKHDINIRAAYVHMIGDAISAFGVVIAGVVVLFTKASLADPIVSFLIAALILKSSWGILRESVTILLEGTPAGLRMADVVASIRNVSGVLNVHDLHVWTVGPGVIACCCHILVAEQSVREGQQVLRAVRQELNRGFKINHTNVQIEVEGHECEDMYCSIQPAEGAHAGHHH
jgi:cobalt-zinc-cadmium efflux system protein